MAHGLEAPFLRPPELSTDHAGALETVVHALECCEHLNGCRYDLVILTEPTSPFRETGDLDVAMKALLRSGADSAVTVSRIDTKTHPYKIFSLAGERLRLDREENSGVEGPARLFASPFDTDEGRHVVVVAQSLEDRDETLSGFLVTLLLVGSGALVLVSLIGYGVAAAALRRVWRATHFSWWMTSMLHTLPGDDFTFALQLSQLRYTTTSRSAATTLAENYTGVAAA